ncbi:hypothetical protein [Geitlerinema sp. PCC 9228]|nr:hypothetical protein [Geitlerinema sp. PCC 9228]
MGGWKKQPVGWKVFPDLPSPSVANDLATSKRHIAIAKGLAASDN